MENEETKKSLAEIGIIEGLVQEPNNIQHYGERLGILSSLTNKFFEERK